MRLHMILAMFGVVSSLLLASCAVVPSEPESGRAIWMMDGDTINMQKRDKTWQIIRLYGIDAPEKDQEYGAESTQRLIDLIGRKQITIQPIAMDRYGRTVAKVYVGKTYVNAEMLRSGAAWWYQQYAPHDTDLADAESEAKHSHAGLWANPNPVPPWKYRNSQKTKGITNTGTVGRSPVRSIGNGVTGVTTFERYAP